MNIHKTPITVKELLLLCQSAIRRGYENRIVLLSQDEEINDTHPIQYGFVVEEPDNTHIILA